MFNYRHKSIVSSILISIVIIMLFINLIENKRTGDNLVQSFLMLIILICLIIYIKKIKQKTFFSTEKINNKYNDLIKYIGKPTYLETDKKGNINEATWMTPLDNYQKNKFAGKSIINKNGLDVIKILGFTGRKYHPIPADMYVIVGKYMYVPPELIGLLKNASETINIEQLQVPHKLNKNFGQDFEHGVKGKSLVTGSCASVTISAITIKFVEDFINSYDKDNAQHNDVELVKRTYDKYLLEYLCEEKKVDIPWFNPSDFGEPHILFKLDKCKKLDVKSYKNILKVRTFKNVAKDTFMDSHKKAN